LSYSYLNTAKAFIPTATYCRIKFISSRATRTQLLHFLNLQCAPSLQYVYEPSELVTEQTSFQKALSTIMFTQTTRLTDQRQHILPCLLYLTQLCNLILPYNVLVKTRGMNSVCPNNPSVGDVAQRCWVAGPVARACERR